MKTKLILAAFLLCTTGLQAAENATAKWINSVSVAPVFALRTEGINGCSTIGAGLDGGVGINDYVSIHAAGYGYEKPDCWRGQAVDEVEVYGKAKFASFVEQKLSLTGKGGAVWDTATHNQDYAISVGAGLDLAINKQFTVGADYSIRAWFQGRHKDSLLRAFVQASF